ncbi:MAG: hypothetical protein Sylvanvirus12_7 [Sylvanvirus sp.]|uniref:Uncharacterized protein n=1 Tax=Sylvanvirus sp. TaxID=2487774 RepID=A0A3G5AI34_9VIRU|nr:MAG: hypothetical protein Sylvanvirus12_7 [Sylvanvirus sp.]
MRNNVENVVVTTRFGSLERAIIPTNAIPRTKEGKINFRPGVFTKGFVETVGDGVWDTLPWYRNPVSCLFENNTCPIHTIQLPQ